MIKPLGLSLVFLGVQLGALMGCSTEVGGGATSETTNGIAQIEVMDGESQALAINTQYKIFRLGTHPDSSDNEISSGVTDSNGVMQFEITETDSFAIEFSTDSKGKRLLEYLEAGKDYNQKSITIESLNIISGKIDLDSSDILSRVYLSGSDHIVPIDSTAKFVFNRVPMGDWQIKFESGASPIEIKVYSGEDITLGTTNSEGGTQDRERLEEVLAKTTSVAVDLDERVEWEVVEGREYAVKIDLSGVALKADDLDGTGLPRMGQMEPIELDLSDNKLIDLPAQWGWDFDRIEKLDVSNNNLTDLRESFRDLRTLKVLDLRNNLINRIPKDLTVLELDSLYVAGNQLADASTNVKEWLDKYAEPNWLELQVP